jgi:uncharacterized integral membrane protein
MRALLAAPFLLLMVLFALSNPQPVKLGLWPTDYSLEAPLSLTVLVAMGVAFLLGSFMTWFGVFGARRRARRAERKSRMLDAQVKELKARGPAPGTALATQGP